MGFMKMVAVQGQLTHKGCRAVPLPEILKKKMETNYLNKSLH
jgi:hypothetical protein